MAHYIDAFPGREVTLGGTNYHYFGGTSYLGIQTDVGFQDILIKNIRKYGTNYGASRKSNIRLSIFETAETYLANLVGSEACLTLSSGYLAGQLVCSYFGKGQGKPFYAPNTHSALQQGTIKPYTTFTSLNIAVREYLASHKKTPPVVFMDAIDFSGNNYPHFEGLKTLPLGDLILVVDDSHGMGIIGDNGSGVFRMISNLGPKELIVCCSLGKSYGVQAGALFGSKKRIAELMSTDFFWSASPTSPANMATLLEAESIYREKRELLKNALSLFQGKVANLGRFNYMENHPAFSFSDNGLTEHLQKNKVIITSFNYPNQDKSAMGRIVLSAAHGKEDVLYVTKVLNSY